MRRQHAGDSSDINMAAIDSESRPAAKGQLLSTNQIADISQWDSKLILPCIAGKQLVVAIGNREEQIINIDYINLIYNLGKRSNKSVCRTAMSGNCDNWQFYPGAYLTYDFSITIQIPWEFCFVLIQVLMKQLLWWQDREHSCPGMWISWRQSDQEE